MPSRKTLKLKKATRRKVNENGGKEFRPPTWAGERTSANGIQYEYQTIRNPYTPGEREKMLEKRDKLTLEAFRIAYENGHKSKNP
jgi:hypothetical protein